MDILYYMDSQNAYILMHSNIINQSLWSVSISLHESYHRSLTNLDTKRDASPFGTNVIWRSESSAYKPDPPEQGQIGLWKRNDWFRNHDGTILYLIS